jgi:N-acetylmuramoyl-L-alanine amidase
MCQEKLKKHLLCRLFCKMNQIKPRPAVILIAVIFCYLEAAAQHTEKSVTGSIVIDIGHGGQDTGVSLSGGIYEKNIALNLARRLEDELFQKEYKVKLTRTRDVGLEMADRTAVSNNRKADVFISLHIGGNFTHQPETVSIFYFDKKSESLSESADDKSRSQALLWDEIQYQHQSESRGLAKLIQKSLQSRIKFAEIRVRGAPILIARGADMPAVLIEIGSLCHPEQKKALQSRQGLSDLAKGISSGIEAFLQKAPTH